MILFKSNSYFLLLNNKAKSLINSLFSSILKYFSNVLKNSSALFSLLINFFLILSKISLFCLYISSISGFSFVSNNFFISSNFLLASLKRISWLFPLEFSYITLKSKKSWTKSTWLAFTSRPFKLSIGSVNLSSLYSLIFIFSNFFIKSIIFLISSWYLSLWKIESDFLLWLNIFISFFIFSKVFFNL